MINDYTGTITPERRALISSAWIKNLLGQISEFRLRLKFATRIPDTI